MTDEQPESQPEIPQNTSEAEESHKNDEVSRTMADYYEKIEEITMRYTSLNLEQVKAELLNPDVNTEDGNGKGQKEVILYHIETNRINESEDQEIFDNCRQRVLQASDVMVRLDKDIKKLEAYNQVLGMVRRDLKRNGITFWNEFVDSD